MTLLLQIEFLEHRSVTLLVMRLKILQVRAAVCNHLQEATAAVKVFRVFAQMGGKFVDALGKQRHLDLRRPGVTLVAADILDDRAFLSLRKHGLIIARIV
jgi:hypothetical protein